MEKLDIKALLDKNEQVDRDLIKARLEKISKVGPVKAKGSRQISPYSGRRITTDDKMKWGAVRRLPRHQAK